LIKRAQERIKNNESDIKNKKDKLENIIEDMLQNQNSLKAFLTSAEKAGVFVRKSLQNKAGHSAHYFKQHIKPQNEYLKQQRIFCEEKKLDSFVVLDDLVHQKANKKARV